MPLDITDVNIFEWLSKQPYQTDYEGTGEYKMYFNLDMPKIIKDAIAHFSTPTPKQELKPLSEITDEDWRNGEEDLSKCHCHKNNVKDKHSCQHYNYYNKCNLALKKGEQNEQ